MDTLSLATSEDAQGDFVDRWQLRRHGAKQPVAGETLVRLHQAYMQDHPSIAELAAIHHPLDETQIHGADRQGAGPRPAVPFGHRRRAVLSLS